MARTEVIFYGNSLYLDSLATVLLIEADTGLPVGVINPSHNIGVEDAPPGRSDI